MFESITLASQMALQTQIDELKATCDKDPAVAEMMKYILAYADQMAYCDGDENARIGRQIIQHIWEISGMDFSSMGNSYHFSPGWASKMNYFIGNYVYDDSAFDFDVSDFNSTIDFKPSGDDGRWLQDPMIIVEAAKANRAYYKRCDESNISDRFDIVADVTKVLEMVNERKN